MISTYYLRSSLNRSGLKQSNPALYEVIDGLLSNNESEVGIWQEWAPSYRTNITLGNGQLEGRYVRIGNLVVATIFFVFGSTTAFAANATIFNLPFPARLESYIDPSNTSRSMLTVGAFNAFDISSNQNFIGSSYIAIAGTSGLAFTPSTSMANVNNIIPFTWAAGDILSTTVAYEAEPL